MKHKHTSTSNMSHKRYAFCLIFVVVDFFFVMNCFIVCIVHQQTTHNSKFVYYFEWELIKCIHNLHWEWWETQKIHKLPCMHLSILHTQYIVYFLRKFLFNEMFLSTYKFLSHTQSHFEYIVLIEFHFLLHTNSRDDFIGNVLCFLFPHIVQFDHNKIMYIHFALSFNQQKNCFFFFHL